MHRICILVSASDHATAAPEAPAPMIRTSTGSFIAIPLVIPGLAGANRNLEIPGSTLCVAPE
jgi:hypothetical protein